MSDDKKIDQFKPVSKDTYFYHYTCANCRYSSCCEILRGADVRGYLCDKPCPNCAVDMLS